MCILHNTHTYTVLGDLCDNIVLVGVSAMWSYVTTSPSHHDQAIPILSPLLFMHVGHPYIPLFKMRRFFDLLVLIWDGNPNSSVAVTNADRLSHPLGLLVQYNLANLLKSDIYAYRLGTEAAKVKLTAQVRQIVGAKYIACRT